MCRRDPLVVEKTAFAFGSSVISLASTIMLAPGLFPGLAGTGIELGLHWRMTAPVVALGLLIVGWALVQPSKPEGPSYR